MPNALQALLDGSDSVIDLAGQTWLVDRIKLTTAHHGKTIRGPGTIKRIDQPAGSPPQYGMIETWQGITRDGQTYAGGDIDFAIENNVVLDGSFDYDCGLQMENDRIATKQNAAFNLITSITKGAGRVRLSDVHFQNCGSSAIALSAKRLDVERCSARRIVQHVVGARGAGGMVVNIAGLVMYECGNAFDFHNEGAFYDAARPDVANVRDLVMVSPRGRTKINGNNWDVMMCDSVFKYGSDRCLNLYPAIDLAKNPRRLWINGLAIEGFPTIAIRAGADAKRTAPPGDIEIANVSSRDTMIFCEPRQPMRINGATISGHYTKYRSGVPTSEIDAIELSIATADEWADRWREIEAAYDALNSTLETPYVAAFTLPNQVEKLLQQSA